VDIDRNMKIGIISSIVATIIFIYLLDPILRFITYSTFNLFGSLTRWYTNDLFQRAALLTGPDPSMDLLALFTGIICGIFSSVTIFSIIRPFLTRGNMEIKAAKTIIKYLRFIIPVLSIVLIILTLFSFHRTLFPLRITSSFNQHLAAIAPYVTEQEIKELRSQWTQMMCEDDYHIICNNLNRIASDNKIRLPKNLLY
jgi:hypothetical protein